MEDFILDKNQFLKAIECKKYLYLNIFRPDLKNKTAVNKIALTNHALVNAFGHELYKDGIDLKNNSVGKDELLLITENALNESGIYYNPTFISKDGRIKTKLDVLVISEKLNRVIEFKSSTSIKLPKHIFDIGYQYRVIKESSFNKKLKFYLAHLNPDYIRSGGIDIEKLFILHDVTQKAKDVQILIDRHFADINKILQDRKIPIVPLTKHCTGCEFYDHCWKNVSKKSIHNLGNIRQGTLNKLERLGITTVDEIPRDTKLTDKQWNEVDALISNKISINKKKLNEFLKSLNLQSPISFMDFETEMPPIPRYDNCKTYQHFPFEFCVLYKENSSSELIRKEFLANPGIDYRRDFIERLLVDTNTEGSIIVYHEAFEKSRLKEMAILFPEYEEAIYDIIDRIRDLSIPFRERIVWHPSFKGSFSIKKILPALCPDLSYDNMEINNGTMAMEQFGRLTEVNQAERDKIINYLKEYCYTDVLAMVKILNVLKTL